MKEGTKMWEELEVSTVTTRYCIWRQLVKCRNVCLQQNLQKFGSCIWGILILSKWLDRLKINIFKPLEGRWGHHFWGLDNNKLCVYICKPQIVLNPWDIKQNWMLVEVLVTWFQSHISLGSGLAWSLTQTLLRIHLLLHQQLRHLDHSTQGKPQQDP